MFIHRGGEWGWFQFIDFRVADTVKFNCTPLPCSYYNNNPNCHKYRGKHPRHPCGTAMWLIHTQSKLRVLKSFRTPSVEKSSNPEDNDVRFWDEEIYKHGWSRKLYTL